MTQTTETYHQSLSPDARRQVWAVNKDDHVARGDVKVYKTLGHDAVSYSFDDARMLGVMGVHDSLMDGTPSPEMIQTFVQQARERLTHLREPQRNLFNAVLSNDQESMWLKSRIITAIEPDMSRDAVEANMSTGQSGETSEDKQPFAYVDGLLAKDESGNYILGDDVMLNFLQWHQYEQVRNQKEFESQVEQYKAVYLRNIATYVKRGDLPTWLTQERLQNRFDHMEVRKDDGLHTIISDSAISPDAFAYGISDNNRESGSNIENFVAMRPDINWDRYMETDSEVLSHEFTHVQDGKDFAQAKQGLMRLHDGVLQNHILNEAIVEHMAFTMENNLSMSDIDPDDVRREHSSYRHERRLLDVLCHGGKQPIDVRLFAAAHFQQEATDLYEGRVPLELLKEEIESAFPGMNLLKRIEDMGFSDVEVFTKQLAGEVQFNKVQTARKRRRLSLEIGKGALVGGVLGAVLIAGLGKVGVFDHEQQQNDTVPTVTVPSNSLEGATGGASSSPEGQNGYSVPARVPDEQALPIGHNETSPLQKNKAASAEK